MLRKMNSTIEYGFLPVDCLFSYNGYLFRKLDDSKAWNIATESIWIPFTKNLLVFLDENTKNAIVKRVMFHE